MQGFIRRRGCRRQDPILNRILTSTVWDARQPKARSGFAVDVVDQIFLVKRRGVVMHIKFSSVIEHVGHCERRLNAFRSESIVY